MKIFNEKKMLLSMSMILLFVLIIPTLIQAAAGEPCLTFPDTMDLEDVKQTQVLERFIVLENTGKADLTIQSISCDCPCSILQHRVNDTYQLLEPETRVVLTPGEQFEFKLIFDANKTKYVGAFKRFIVIHSNDPKQPIARVRLVGRLVEEE